MGVYCVVSGCKNRGGHCFPTKSNLLRKAWIARVQREDSWNPSGHSRVCPNHFLPSDYLTINAYGKHISCVGTCYLVLATWYVLVLESSLGSCYVTSVACIWMLAIFCTYILIQQERYKKNNINHDIHLALIFYLAPTHRSTRSFFFPCKTAPRSLNSSLSLGTVHLP